MLEAISFRNYRCFGEHRLPLASNTIIVGRNNAGKSTIIEGFRLLSIFSERYPNLNFNDAPGWADIPRIDRGMRADLAGLSLSWQNLFHRYQPPPARVEGYFCDQTTLTIHLGPDGAVHAVVRDSRGRPVQTKGQARSVPMPAVRVLPQVSPLAREETVLGEDYVRANLSSYLAPQHFRNQLRLFPNEFPNFKRLVESTWPGLQILELDQGHGRAGDPVGLLVRDGDFVAEVAWMGHGLQMWLQTMWFVVRTPRDATVVLDEPDVYMHPDLQRKLVRFLRGRFRQVIVATHSTEILAEANVDDILMIDRLRNRSQFATDLPAVQHVAAHLGSAQNLALTRLWSAKRLVLIEGNDLPYLRRFHELLYPRASQALDSFPNMPIGGWNGWPYAVGSAMLLTNAGGEDIRTYCILDSDYHTPLQVEARRCEAVEKRVQLHVWRKKEIENYLVQDDLIHRLLVTRTPSHIDPPSIEQVSSALDELCDSLRDQTTDSYAQEFLNDDRRGGLASANRHARRLVKEAWQNRSDRMSIVSGKDLLSGMSKWAQENFQASFGPAALLAQLREDEIVAEIREVVAAIETGGSFQS